MALALRLARRGWGRVWPNPAVGCVIVNDGRVIGRGWTQPGGRPHAETEALARAGAASRGATAYVTLEPCAHHGKTAPCAEALIESGVARVVVAIADPDPRVDGDGIAMLRAAGVQVDIGADAARARDVNAGYLRCAQSGRPLVNLKLAMTVDGRLATRSGQSRWITGDGARARAHYLRATHDAILVGSGTVLADDPRLDCRLPGMADRSPQPIVLDRRCRLRPSCRLLSPEDRRTPWIFGGRSPPEDWRNAMERAGAVVMDMPAGDSDAADIRAVLAELGDRGVTRLLVEGGAAVAASFVAAGVVDRLSVFRAPRLLGGDALGAIGALGLDRVEDGPVFRRESVVELGADILETYRADH